MKTVKEWLHSLNNKMDKEYQQIFYAKILTAYSEHLEKTDDTTILNYEIYNPLEYDYQFVQFEGFYNSDNKIYRVLTPIRAIENWYYFTRAENLKGTITEMLLQAIDDINKIK